VNIGFFIGFSKVVLKKMNGCEYMLFSFSVSQMLIQSTSLTQKQVEDWFRFEVDGSIWISIFYPSYRKQKNVTWNTKIFRHGDVCGTSL